MHGLLPSRIVTQAARSSACRLRLEYSMTLAMYHAALQLAHARLHLQCVVGTQVGHWPATCG